PVDSACRCGFVTSDRMSCRSCGNLNGDIPGMMSGLKRGVSGPADGEPEQDRPVHIGAWTGKAIRALFGKRHGRFLTLLATGSALAGLAGPAYAAAGGRYLATGEIVTFSMALGVLSAAMVCAIWMVRQRGRMEAENRDLKTHLSDARHNISRLQALIGDKNRRIVVWDGLSQRPEFLGQLPPETGAPAADRDFLAFGRWLKPTAAAEIERAIEKLRSQAQSFDLIV